MNLLTHIPRLQQYSGVFLGGLSAQVILTEGGPLNGDAVSVSLDGSVSITRLSGDISADTMDGALAGYVGGDLVAPEFGGETC